jgi:hypothetical protein
MQVILTTEREPKRPSIAARLDERRARAFACSVRVSPAGTVRVNPARSVRVNPARSVRVNSAHSVRVNNGSSDADSFGSSRAIARDSNWAGVTRERVAVLARATLGRSSRVDARVLASALWTKVEMHRRLRGDKVRRRRGEEMRGRRARGDRPADRALRRSRPPGRFDRDGECFGFD